MTVKNQIYKGRIFFAMFFILMVSGFIFMRNIDKTSSTQKTTQLYTLHNYINDYAKILTPEQSRQINRKLRSYKQSTGNQLVVVTVNKITGYAPEIYSVKLAQKNGIGKKGKDRGVLFIISKQDHFMRIEVGMGLEDKLTDVKCSLILKNIVKPYFKNNQFDVGIISGLASIVNTISGTHHATQLFPNINKSILVENITHEPSKVNKKPNITKEKEQHPILNMVIIGLILISLIAICIRYPKFLGLIVWIIIAILNSRGGGRGGSSGGFSGGGGSFGGGGSSDSW